MDKPFNKTTVLEAIQSEENFDAFTREFLITSTLLHYPLTDEDRACLLEVTEPKEFSLKFLELALGRWFYIVRGE